MAKKLVRRKKLSVAASSSKTGKSSASKNVKSSVKKNTNVKSKLSYRPKPSAKAKSSNRSKPKPKKRVSYKQEYIDLLKKTNKTLTKEVQAIHRAIAQPKKIELPDDFEAFPKEEPAQSVQTRSRGKTSPLSIEEEILGKLTDIEMEIRSRDSLLDDLVHGSPKTDGGLNGN